MDVTIVEDFLDSATCEQLREDAAVYCPKELGIVIHGGRNFIPFSSSHFRLLLERSPAWRRLNSRLQSQEFLDWVIEELAPPGCDKDLRSTVCFGKRRSWISKRIQEEIRRRTNTHFELARGGRFGQLAVSALIKLRVRWIDSRRLTIYLWQRLKGNTAVEVLYDYSRASDGYFREIHRDSDERRYVFILYLNDLEELATGGNLRIHKMENPQVGYPGRPSEDDCILLQSYPPIEGCMVIFRNTYESYHSVERMSGHSRDRDFLYGGITQLGGTNPNMDLAVDDMPTEFGLYT